MKSMTKLRSLFFYTWLLGLFYTYYSAYYWNLNKCTKLVLLSYYSIINICCVASWRNLRIIPWYLKCSPRWIVFISCPTPEVNRLRFSQSAVSQSLTWLFYSDFANSQYKWWPQRPHIPLSVAFSMPQGFFVQVTTCVLFLSTLPRTA